VRRWDSFRWEDACPVARGGKCLPSVLVSSFEYPAVSAGRAKEHYLRRTLLSKDVPCVCVSLSK
jgi:hypothetical protein